MSRRKRVRRRKRLSEITGMPVRRAGAHVPSPRALRMATPVEPTRQTWAVYPGNDFTRSVIEEYWSEEKTYLDQETSHGRFEFLLEVPRQVIDWLESSRSPDLKFVTFRKVGEANWTLHKTYRVEVLEKSA